MGKKKRFFTHPTDWDRSKYTDLANYIPDDISKAGNEVYKSINHIRFQQSLLRPFLKRPNSNYSAFH
jgi:hypothetical protein